MAKYFASISAALLLAALALAASPVSALASPVWGT